MAIIPNAKTTPTIIGMTVKRIPRIRLFFAIPGSLSLMQAQEIIPPITEKNIGSRYHAALGFTPCIGYCDCVVELVLGELFNELPHSVQN